MTTPFVNFVTNPEADDTIIIGGMAGPGIAKVAVSKKHTWDKKKGAGSTGGTVTYKGTDLASFEVEFYLWLPEHFNAWPTFAAMLAKSTPTSISGGTSKDTKGAAPPQTGNVRVATPPPTTTAATAGAPEPTALDVYHPSLVEPPFNITRCIVEEPGGKEPDGKGGAKYKYKFSEYNPSKAAGGTASGSKDGSTTTPQSPQKFTEPPAASQSDQEIDKLLKKAGETT